MPFFRTAPKRVSSGFDPSLLALAEAHMPGAEPESQRIVVALAGLLAGVAHADRSYRAAERTFTRSALERVQELTPEGVTAICDLLAARGATLAVVNPQAYTRELRESTELEFRREVLELLVELAAADGELALAETDLLRRTSAALGLTQDDYVAAQAQHRDKLKVLR